MLMTPLDSIFTSDMAIGRYVAQRAGIGINAGRIPWNQQQNPGAEKYSTLALFLSLKSLNQLYDAVRKMGIPWWISNSPLPNLAPRNRRYYCS